jgi:hypothetical protein
MAITLYKEHLVVSSAKFHPKEQQWIPSVIITWKVGREHHFHDIKGMPNRFDTTHKAENYGLQVAKAWVDERLLKAG